MSDLSELQLQMAKALTQRRALPEDPAAVTLAESQIGGSDRLSPVEQLEIYREQFWLRHTSSLVEDFPGLGGVIGQKAWERLVEEYLEASPPNAFSLRDLGLGLPAFVESATWLDHRALCADMARLEVAYIEAFDAQDAPLLDPARLAAIPESAWETAKLVLSPSLSLLSVRYPVADLRRRLRTSTDDDVPIPEPQPQKLVIYRQGLQLFDMPVTDGAFALLSALRRGEPLVRACEVAQAELGAGGEQLAEKLGGWFQDWARNTWIADVIVSS